MSQVEKRSAAGAVGAKTARACDSCLRRRARWYCAADDAFLCQGCDSSVHSANPLARRHERVRLKTSSSAIFKAATATTTTTDVVDDDACSNEPTWHHGFKRKARTPRGGGGGGFHRSPKLPEQKEEVEEDEVIMNRISTDPLVPDLETASLEDFAAVEEEQLLYRVPIFDPVLAEFCSPPVGSYDDVKPATVDTPQQPDHLSAATPVQGISGFLLPSDMDLAEFEMNVENLLGRGLDEDAFCMEGLGLMGSRDDGCVAAALAIKKEEEIDDDLSATAGGQFNIDMDLSRDTFDINFDSGSPTTGEDASEGEEIKPAVAAERSAAEEFGEGKKRRIMLKLDYQAVISAWSAQGCPWTNGERPQFNPDDCWPDYMGMTWGGGTEVQGGAYGGGVSSHGAQAANGGADGGREARVSRYREKRRTRLFSKKIRYEVRKLNAEKRPRMKGRFVKRASFAVAAGVAGGAAVAKPQFAF